MSRWPLGLGDWSCSRGRAVTPPRLVALVVGVTSSEVVALSGETNHVSVIRHAILAATAAHAGPGT